MALIRFGKVKVSDLLHFSDVKIQVKHLDHFLRICIKVLGKDTIYRIEELKQSKISAVEYINDVFNPTEKIGTRLYGISERLDKLTSFQVDNGWGLTLCNQATGAEVNIRKSRH